MPETPKIDHRRLTLPEDRGCAFIPLHAVLLTGGNIVSVGVCRTRNDNVCVGAEYASGYQLSADCFTVITQ